MRRHRTILALAAMAGLVSLTVAFFAPLPAGEPKAQPEKVPPQHAVW